MATAYVSPVGSAAYPGTVGAPTSLATALSSASAGDIVYLAPGSYRGTFTLGVSGTAGNTIQFIGDPLATQNIGGIAAGIVRVTNYLNDAANPTAAILLTVSSRNYWSFTNIYFEAYTTGTYAYSLATSTNWSFEKCVFISKVSRGFTITTTANVAQNASFNKCIFNIGSYAIDLNGANHSGNYSLNMSFADCITFSTLLQSFNGSAGNNTNAGGISIYNLTAYSNFTTQLYQSNTTHPTTVYNSVLINMGGGVTLWTNVAGSLIENYNLVSGITNAITAGANSFYAGAFGLDYGYSAIVGLPAPSVNGPYIGSRLLGAGTASGAPATDIDGAAWYQSLLGMGAYTFTSRNNGITFPAPPTPNTITIAPGSTSQSIEVLLGVTGLTASTSGLSARYNRTRTASVDIPLVARTIAQAWTSGGFAEVDATNMPGVYRLDLPDAALAAGADDVTIVVRGASGTNGAVMTVKLSSGGLTSAQTAAAVWDEARSSHVTAGTFGQYVNAELVTPVTSAALVRMGPYEVKADGLGASDPLDIQKGAQHGVDIQCVDAFESGIDITSATVTAKVYNSGATLVDTYACTATYAADGRATFTIDTTVTDVPGTYTATITRTTGASDTQVFGPLRIYVRDI